MFCRDNRELYDGPVITVHTFESAADVVECVNETRFGLSNLVWTTDLSTAHMVADALECGTVTVDEYPVLSPAAVSGGGKESGIGRAREHKRSKRLLRPRM